MNYLGLKFNRALRGHDGAERKIRPNDNYGRYYTYRCSIRAFALAGRENVVNTIFARLIDRVAKNMSRMQSLQLGASLVASVFGQ